MAQVLDDDNTRAVRGVTPANGRAFTLEEMQALVGGLVQMLTIPSGQVLLFNEEGKYNKLYTLNTVGTHLARAAGIAPNDYVVGPCVLATRTEAGFDDCQELVYEEDEDYRAQ